MKSSRVIWLGSVPSYRCWPPDLLHPSYYSDEIRWSRSKLGTASSYYSDEIRWSRRFTDAVIWRPSYYSDEIRICRCCFTWDHRHLLWEIGGQEVPMLFYRRPSYYSDEISWTTWFHQSVLLWWNQVVQEVYRCCFTWDTSYYSDKIGWSQCCFTWETAYYKPPGLGTPSYYSDEIRWSKVYSMLFYLGHPEIRWSRITWWDIRVIWWCPGGKTDAVKPWDTRHLLWVKSGGPGGLRCCFTWDTRHITLMKSGGPGGLWL